MLNFEIVAEKSRDIHPPYRGILISLSALLMALSHSAAEQGNKVKSYTIILTPT